MARISLDLIYRPWRRFRAFLDEKQIQRFLDAVERESLQAFKQGIESPKNGIKHASLPNRSSAPGEYPAKQSGGLLRSIKVQRTNRSVKIGTTAPYSKFLVSGTRYMAKRKMSKEALQEGMQAAREQQPRGFAAWKAATEIRKF